MDIGWLIGISSAITATLTQLINIWLNKRKADKQLKYDDTDYIIKNYKQLAIEQEDKRLKIENKIVDVQQKIIDLQNIHAETLMQNISMKQEIATLNAKIDMNEVMIKNLTVENQTLRLQIESNAKLAIKNKTDTASLSTQVEDLNRRIAP